MAGLRVFSRNALKSTVLKNSPNACLEIKRTAIQPAILDIDTPLYPIDEIHKFITNCMVAVNVKKEYALFVADVLAAADYKGHYSHGLNRLAMYVKELKAKICDGNATPVILRDSQATGLVDGKNGLGAVISHFCMTLAIKKAKEFGAGWVVARGGNHYGIAGHWAEMAVKEDCLGFSCTNSSPLQVPTRAKESALGTNPIGIAIPGVNGDSFVLDMATTAVAVGKLEIAKRRNEPLLEGWALDKEGKMTTDQNVAYEAKRLLPLGGLEQSSGYKGSGLALFVDLVSGVLSGGGYGKNIRSWGSTSTEPANLGHCYMALDITRFAPCFPDRVSQALNEIRSMEPSDCKKPIYVAGDIEKFHMQSVDKFGGVRYVPDQLKTNEELVKLLKVTPMKPKDGKSKQC